MELRILSVRQSKAIAIPLIDKKTKKTIDVSITLSNYVLLILNL